MVLVRPHPESDIKVLYGEEPTRKSQSLTKVGAMESPASLPVMFASSVSQDIDSENYPSTPPAQLLSSQPRTPRPIRFLSPPRTPLPQLFTSFPTEDDSLKEARSAREEAKSISRPGSACSNYSSSSDSSFDSLTTFNTTGGSCTSPETEASFFPDNLTKGSQGGISREFTTSNSHKEESRTAVQKKLNFQSGARKVQWTEDMDGHLWRTYIMFKQNPKITPFFALPGQVPPLGVCHKVAREAKRSWKEAKIGDGWRGPLNTVKSRQKRLITPVHEVGVGGNKGDVLRKTSPYCWPASESSTRRRLRELCRRSYGPSCNPHHSYQQRRPVSVSGTLPSRSSTVSPSPYKSSLSDRSNSHDASLFSTRGIALSLTTSTSSTMNPNSVLAAIAAGHDVDAGMTVKIGSSDVNLGGISGRASRVNNNGHSTIGMGGFANMGSSLRSVNAVFRTSQDGTTGTGMLGISKTAASVSTPNGPILLPPLEMKSFSSAYGTWPRRQKRQEEQSGDESIISPPPRRARRGTIGDLFGEPVPVPTVPRTRSRGFTIGSASGNSVNRKRFRQFAPLLTVTGPVSYDSPNDGESLSPLATRESVFSLFQDSSKTPNRSGLSFAEAEARKVSDFEGSDEVSPEIDNDEFLQRGRRGSEDGIASVRPVTRAREVGGTRTE